MFEDRSKFEGLAAPSIPSEVEVTRGTLEIRSVTGDPGRIRLTQSLRPRSRDQLDVPRLVRPSEGFGEAVTAIRTFAENPSSENRQQAIKVLTHAFRSDPSSEGSDLLLKAMNSHLLKEYRLTTESPVGVLDAARRSGTDLSPMLVHMNAELQAELKGLYSGN